MKKGFTFSAENYTEELLTTHEHQVEAVRNYYEENKALYKLVEKRENMFKKMEEFEVSTNSHSKILEQLVLKKKNMLDLLL